MTEAVELATRLLASALGIIPAAVQDSMAPGTTTQWDSLAHINLILSLEAALGRQLPAEAIISIVSRQDLIAIIEQSG